MDYSISIDLGGRAVTVRPLTLGQMQKYEAPILALAETNPDGGSYLRKMVALLPLVAECTGLPEDEIGALVNIRNFPEVWRAIMSVAGLASATPGEVTPQSVN